MFVKYSKTILTSLKISQLLLLIKRSHTILSVIIKLSVISTVHVQHTITYMCTFKNRMIINDYDGTNHKILCENEKKHRHVGKTIFSIFT